MQNIFFDKFDFRKIIAAPYEHEFHVRIPDKFWGMTVDEYYAKRFPYKEREGWLKSIEEGRIQINGKNIRSDYVIKANDILDSHVKGIVEPPINPDFKNIFEDEHLIVVDKPGHLAVHPTGRYYKHSYLQMVLEKEPTKKVHLLHRLDVETSGLLIVGKTHLIATKFFQMFKEKKIHKEYTALVRGVFPLDGVYVDAPIGNNTKSKINVKMEVNGKDAKEAISKFELLEHRGEVSKIKCIPITGRTNQLRVHLEYIGFPILGDKMYCNDDSVFTNYHESGETEELKEKLIIYRQALHASKVHFVHPVSQKDMVFESPFPVDIDYYPN